MVGSGKKLYSGPKGREQVCGLGEGAASPHQLGRGLPSGVWGAAPAEIEFGTFISRKIWHLVTAYDLY